MSSTAISSDKLAGFAQAILARLGADESTAALIADSLISAELEGIASHGVMLLPMYIDRIKAGSIVLSAKSRILKDLGGLVVMTADHGPGQVSSQAAVGLAVERARIHGTATITVRDAGHFGAASYWVRQIAAHGMIGMAFSNTRPLMPAPGGAEKLIGNNPLAMAFPSRQGQPLVVDMAMSASAMGKIRLAEVNKESIPIGWATNAKGEDTQSPTEAIAGMLLPAAGPKGFGLAVAIELLCGALSGGGVAAAVKPLFGNPAEFYNCSHTFIAIDASRLDDSQGLAQTADDLGNAIRASSKKPGVDRIYAPGDIERSRRENSKGLCAVSAELLSRLDGLSAEFNLQRLVG